MFLLDFFSSFTFFCWEDLLTFFFFYNILSFLFFSSISDLIWPTLYFNRKHTIGFKIFRLRVYTETLQKLRNSTPTFAFFTSILISFYCI